MRSSVYISLSHSFVPSVEASSATIISKSCSVCASTLPSAREMSVLRLYEGMMTDTRGSTTLCIMLCSILTHAYLQGVAGGGGVLQASPTKNAAGGEHTMYDTRTNVRYSAMSAMRTRFAFILTKYTHAIFVRLPPCFKRINN